MNEYIDIYCERIAPGLLNEPVNLLTNLSFIFAALFVWPRVRHDIAGRLLAIALFTIGVCSGLYHSFATQWASAADVLSILVFVLIYIYFATRRLLQATPLIAALAVVLFIPYSAVIEPIIKSVTGPLNGSTAYLPILLLNLIYAVIALWRHMPTAKGIFIACALLTVSLFFRSYDASICEAMPLGTHFLWHIMNGILLGWMTLVMVRMPKAP